MSIFLVALGSTFPNQLEKGNVNFLLLYNCIMKRSYNEQGIQGTIHTCKDKRQSQRSKVAQVFRKMFEELPCRNFCYSATCHNNVKLEPTTYGSDRYYYSFPSPDGTYFGKLFFQHHLIPIGQLNLKISHIILTLGYAIITKGSKWI